MARQQVEVDYAPRPLQWALHGAIDAHRWTVSVTHRRFGKTVCGANHLQKACLSCKLPRPRFHYIAPTYRMGKAIAWDYLKFYARDIPGVTTNESELRVNYPNEGQVQILGADSPDSMRGIYSDGALFDEYGMQPANVFTEIMRPAFADRGGWAAFFGTPNGKNQFYDIVQQARGKVAEGDPAWFLGVYKASESGILSASELAAARSVMTQDEYDQEFECSFEAAVKGAVYSQELQAARLGSRVGTVPCDPILPVDTDWDLGVGDSTAIWFSQSLRSGEVRLVDYYEASGEGLPHYAQILNAKGYTYGSHYAPFDIQVKELGSGRSRLETAASLGIRFKIAPKLAIEDGIHAARMLFPKCWFDAQKCRQGLEALQHYRRDYNARLNEFKTTTVHDWASHGADAFRYLAVRQQPPEPEISRHYVSRYPSSGGGDSWLGI